MKKNYLFLLIILLAGILNNMTAQTFRYVKEAPEGTGDGSSWQNASNDLQAMINASAENDIIWVAAGTYIPVRPADNLEVTDPDNRDNAFVLKKNVSIYGGFLGTETDLLQRDWENNITILSGDMGIIEDTSDNAYHVVISAGDVGFACLDGFIITGGNAEGDFEDYINVNGYSIDKYAGSGIYNFSSSPSLTNLTILYNTAANGGGIYNFSSSPKISNILITNNIASSGGGIYNLDSSPTLINLTISNNEANYDGGGIYNRESHTIVMYNLDISNNIATTGGGICNEQSSIELTNVKITNNTATSNGAGIYNGLALAILTNVIIVNNIADSVGGGMDNYSISSIILTNVTIANNTASSSGGGINNYYCFSKIHNSIIWGNTLSDGTVNNIENDTVRLPSYGYNLVGGEDIGNGIILNSDPLFIDTSNGNFRLSGESPCIAAGSIAFYNADSVPDLSGITTDIEGNPRLVNGQIDLGAYQTTDDTEVIKFNADNIKIYPNPVKDILYIESTITVEQVSIYDISGKLMKQINKTQDQIHVGDLANGIYIVKIKTVKNETINMKMVKGRD